MKVQLAYPLELDGKSHKPDATVEVEDAVGRRLIRDGRARVVASKSASSGNDKKG